MQQQWLIKSGETILTRTDTKKEAVEFMREHLRDNPDDALTLDSEFTADGD